MQPFDLDLKDCPPQGQRVTVITKSGKQVIARLDYMPISFFRKSDELEWLTDGDKFISVGFDPVIAWREL